jgi:F-type H+-transporting ATPase subunit a
MGPHISIKGEIITNLFGLPITNSFITTILVMVAFFFIARFYNSEINKTDRSLGFYALHGAIKWLYDMFESVLGKHINTFFTLVGGFFFFILLMNWSGLVPGVGSILVEGEHAKVPLFRGGTADLNTTFALALISVFGTQLFGFKFLGPLDHLKKYFDFRDPIMILLGPLELIGEVARIVSFAFRLYGNIFAGEVLLSIIPFLLPVFLSFVVSPLFFMEIFVGLVQALVFAMLSTVFINMAISTHH